jgi:hypothetical protein
MLLAALAWSSYWERKQPVFQNASKLLAALHTFSRDQLTRGRQVPPEVSLQDLLKGCYLASDDVRAFEGMDVVFFTTSDEAQPPPMLARVRMPDGTLTCLMADGSVQGLTQSRYEEYRKSLARRSGSTNGGQPLRLGTNQAPAGVGARP